MCVCVCKRICLTLSLYIFFSLILYLLYELSRIFLMPKPSLSKSELYYLKRDCVSVVQCLTYWTAIS